MPRMSNCPYCGKLTDLNLDTCPHCGGSFRKKAAPGPRKGTGQRQTCPNCHALVQEGDIICVACGTNLLTGQRVTEQKKASPAEPAGVPIWLWALLGLLIAALAIVVGYIVFAERTSALEQARTLDAQGRVLEATQVLQGYVQKHPDSAQAQFELGKLLWKTGQYPKAAEAFEKVVTLQPQNLEAALLEVLCLAPAADMAPGSAHINALEKVVAAFPKERDAWYLLALARGVTKDIPGGIKALETVAALSPNDPASRRMLGIALAIQGDLAGAERELNAALVEEPDSADTLASAGLVASLAGKPEQALQILTKAAREAGPVGSQVLTQLGVILVAQGRIEDAQGYLGQAVQGIGASETARFFHALGLESQGHPSEALEELNRLVAERGPHAAEAAARAALIELNQGNATKAQNLLQSAPQGSASAAMIQTILGMTYVAAGEEAAAVDAFKRAVQADPNYPAVHLESGLLYLKRQDFAEAVRELKRYMALLKKPEAGASVDAVQALVNQLEQTLPVGGPPPVGGEAGGSGRRLS